MQTITGVTLADVQAVYDGAEGDLWELVMGEQIHIGGFVSSMDLAERAGIGSGMSGVDLCCCNGAGMRFLVRFRDVAHMIGVDATETVLARGRERTRQEGLSDRIEFVGADVCDSGLGSAEADFLLRIRFSVSIPSIPGIITSSRTRSKSWLSISSRAFSPLSASTTSKP